MSAAEDPEKILDQAVSDMQNDLIRLRQAAAEVRWLLPPIIDKLLTDYTCARQAVVHARVDIHANFQACMPYRHRFSHEALLHSLETPGPALLIRCASLALLSAGHRLSEAAAEQV